MKAIAILFLILSLVACAGSKDVTVDDINENLSGVITIDGKIDAAEAALLRVPIGLILANNPKIVPYAYAISTSALAFAESGDMTTGKLNDKINEEIAALDLTPEERQSLVETKDAIVAIVLKQIKQEVELEDDADEVASKVLSLSVGILEVVQSAAAARV